MKVTPKSLTAKSNQKGREKENQNLQEDVLMF